MNTAEALDRLLLYRQTPESLLRRLMDPAETVRTAAQAELVALAVENPAGRATCGAAASRGR